ncbi:MAG TPA: hypothetical protein VFT33_05755, partial [Gaiellaceae bacterium]|nr:hypothetical protein [Gaiellaceae bacterium]
HEDEVRSVWVSPDGREVVTASTDGTARVWDASGDPELREVTRVPGRPPVLERVDGGTAIVDSGQRRYAVLLSTGRVTPMGRPAPPSSRLGPWTVRIDGDVVQLSRPGKTLVLRGHRDDVTSVRLSPDGSRILTASADHDVRRWSAVDGTPLPVIKAHVGRVTDARYSPDGRWIVTAGPGAAGVWNADTGQRLFYLRGVEGKLVSAAFAPDGRTIVATGEDGTVRTYRCDVCGEIDELLVLADRTLARTGRRLTADERRQYLGD